MWLNGLLRYQIIKEWVKRGRPGEQEEFVKSMCGAMSIRYRDMRTGLRRPTASRPHRKTEEVSSH